MEMALMLLKVETKQQRQKKHIYN